MAANVANVRFVQAGLGEGKLPEAAFDRELLCTVLGEILDREAALAEIFKALKPGGILSVTEVLPIRIFRVWTPCVRWRAGPVLSKAR